EREEKREGYHRIERSYGVFARSFTLPATLEADKATAEQKNGVLRIFVPKRAEAKPKSISVKGNQSPVAPGRRRPMPARAPTLPSSGGGGRGRFRASLPEVRLADLGSGEERLPLALHHHLARLQHVAEVGEVQREVGVLLHEEDADPASVHLAED